MSQLLTNLLIFSLLISGSLAATDDNICDSVCEFCCRDKICRSQEECKGNFSAFVILGIVAGSLIGLVLLRLLCKKFGICVKSDKPENKNKEKSRSAYGKNSKAKAASKSPRDKVSARSKDKLVEDRNYSTIDNDSIVERDLNNRKKSGESKKDEDLEQGTKKVNFADNNDESQVVQKEVHTYEKKKSVPQPGGDNKPLENKPTSKPSGNSKPSDKKSSSKGTSSGDKKSSDKKSGDKTRSSSKGAGDRNGRPSSSSGNKSRSQSSGTKSKNTDSKSSGSKRSSSKGKVNNDV